MGQRFCCTILYGVPFRKEHGLKPTEREEPPGKVQCPICEEDFAYKGHRDAHLKMCKRDVNRIKTLQATRAPEHIGMINRWLWDKPPIEPSILAQQQDLQKQQQVGHMKIQHVILSTIFR